MDNVFDGDKLDVPTSNFIFRLWGQLSWDNFINAFSIANTMLFKTQMNKEAKSVLLLKLIGSINNTVVNGRVIHNEGFRDSPLGDSLCDSQMLEQNTERQ